MAATHGNTSLSSATLEHAGRIWDYLASFSGAGRSDAIVVCCSYDLRVCDKACELLAAGLAPRIVFSGKAGNWTRGLWDRSEAEVFRNRALERGADPDCLIVEDQATHIGENIARSRALIPEARAVTFLTKPNTMLRVRLTVPVQWPDVRAYTACPEISFPGEISNVVGAAGVIHEMAGDIQRILEYPGLGYQVEHQLPGAVLESWGFLVREGYTGHMTGG